jgi:peptidoglycan hydrolase CwlO-like protein
MTRGQAADLGERIVGVEKDVKHLSENLDRHAEEAKAAAAQAREDRKAMHTKMDAILDELRKDREHNKARDVATNDRIDAYEHQVKGGKRVLGFIATVWGGLTGSMGAAVMYWIKAGSPPMPPR